MAPLAHPGGGVYKQSYVKSRRCSHQVIDSLGRATTSARHAQRLSAAAAEAFSNEAEVLHEVKAVFEAAQATSQQ